MFSENKTSWPEAKKDCSRKYGGRLANIMDRETSDFINNYRNYTNLGELDAWIGLSWNGDLDQYTWNQYTGTTGVLSFVFTVCKFSSAYTHANAYIYIYIYIYIDTQYIHLHCMYVCM